MKSITKKLFYLILLGAINHGVCVIHWIPNKFLEILLWVTFIGSILLMIYFIIEIIKESYKILNQKHSIGMTYSVSTLITLGLFSLFGVVNFINFLFFAFSGSYVNEYVFDDKKFYVYDTSFRDSMSEISVRMDYLPIRKEMVTVQETAKDMALYREDKMIYFFLEKEKYDLYDLNTSTVVLVWG